MRIYSDHHTAESIRAALTIGQTAGLIHPAVIIAKLDQHGSRKRRRAFEVQLGAPGGTPSFLAADAREYLIEAADDGTAAAKRAAKRFSRNGYGTAPADSPLTATWHEWGFFLAVLFDADGDMSTAPYLDTYHFAAETDGSHLSWRAYDYRAHQGRLADFLTAVADLPDAIDASERGGSESVTATPEPTARSPRRGLAAHDAA